MTPSAKQAACTSLAVEAQSIRDLMDYMDWDALSRAVQAIQAAPSIITCASGTSGIAARKMAHSLCCVEKNASFLPPCEAVHGGLGRVHKGDCVIIVSRGGKTSEIFPILSVCKKKEAVLIAVTENPQSPIGKAADIILPLKVGRESDPLEIMATSSYIATIALFDALLAAFMVENRYSLEQFRLIHPGGAVGEQLNAESSGH